MSELALIGTIRDVYHRGENVMEFLKNDGDRRNDDETVMISQVFRPTPTLSVASRMIAR